jgi:hypothetical protein
MYTSYDMLGWQIVTAATVKVGDRLDLDGYNSTVVNMIALPGGHKRLIFEDGGTYRLGIDERCYAYRAPT